MARWSGMRAVASSLVVALGVAWGGEVFAANGGEPPSAYPRFVSLRADKVNLHAGPAANSAVQWVYQRKEWPVEVIGYWDHFWRIRDWEGTEGWVRETLITNKRGIIVSGGIRGIRQTPDPGAPLLARAEPGVMGRLLECRAGWCRIETGEITGWIERSNIWGVYPNETVP